jgi:hypothetical protein
MTLVWVADYKKSLMAVAEEKRCMDEWLTKYGPRGRELEIYQEKFEPHDLMYFEEGPVKGVKVRR